MKLIFLLIAVVSILNGQTPKGCEIVEKWDFNNWKVWSIILLISSVGIASIFIMISKFIGKPELAETAKLDLQQILLTAVFLLIFSSLALFMCTINLKDLGFDKDIGVFEAAEKYFDYSRIIVVNHLGKGATMSMYFTALTSISAGVTAVPKIFGTKIPMTFIFSPFAGFNVFIQMIRFSMNIIQLSYAAQVAYIVLLKIIEVSFLNLLIPVGIILRCFTPTRNVGGILLAISLGLFLLYPSIFAFFYAATGFRSASIRDLETWEVKLITDWTIPLVMYARLGGLIGLGLIIYHVIAILMIIINEVVGYIAGFGEIILFTFVIPAVAWIIIGAAVRDLSRFFGEEIDISSLARMI